MESALVVLVIIVALVAIDVIGQMEWKRNEPKTDEAAITSTGKIVVDLSSRDGRD